MPTNKKINIAPVYLNGRRRHRRGHGTVCKNGNSFKAECLICGYKAKVFTFASREAAEKHLARVIAQRDAIYDDIENGAITPAEAETHLKLLISGEEINCGINANTSFAVYTKDYLDTVILGKFDNGSLRNSTVANYRGYLSNYVMNSGIGLTPLSKLERSNFIAFTESLMKQGLSKKTVMNIIKFCNQILSFAKDDGLIDDIPINMKRIGIMLNKGRRAKEPDTYSEAELSAVVAAAYSLKPVYGLLIETVSALGLRKGEALGLRYSDIDFAHGTVQLKRAVRREATRDSIMETLKDGEAKSYVNIEAPLKTPLSQRRLKLDEKLSEKFVSMKNAQKFSNGESFSDDMYIFTNDDGKVIDPDYVNAILKNACSIAGIRVIKVHELRNTSATNDYKNGLPFEEIQRKLGHTSASMTERYISA